MTRLTLLLLLVSLQLVQFAASASFAQDSPPNSKENYFTVLEKLPDLTCFKKFKEKLRQEDYKNPKRLSDSEYCKKPEAVKILSEAKDFFAAWQAMASSKAQHKIESETFSKIAEALNEKNSDYISNARAAVELSRLSKVVMLNEKNYEGALQLCFLEFSLCDFLASSPKFMDYVITNDIQKNIFHDLSQFASNLKVPELQRLKNLTWEKLELDDTLFKQAMLKARLEILKELKPELLKMVQLDADESNASHPISDSIKQLNLKKDAVEGFVTKILERCSKSVEKNLDYLIPCAKNSPGNVAKLKKLSKSLLKEFESKAELDAKAILELKSAFEKAKSLGTENDSNAEKAFQALNTKVQNSIGDLLAGSLADLLSSTTTQRAETQVARRCLCLMIELELQFRKSAAYPEQLIELRKLAQLDQYNGEALNYRKTNTGYILWSVGENLINDGGVDHRTEPGLDREKYLDLVYPIPTAAHSIRD